MVGPRRLQPSIGCALVRSTTRVYRLTMPALWAAGLSVIMSYWRGAASRRKRPFFNVEPRTRGSIEWIGCLGRHAARGQIFGEMRPRRSRLRGRISQGLGGHAHAIADQQGVARLGRSACGK